MSKYRNKKVILDGITFDSIKESTVYSELKLRKQAGDINGFERQVSYELIPKQNGERAVIYKADFVVTDGDGTTTVIDVKGVKTRDYIIKRKLMLYIHKIRIKEV